MGVPRGQSCGLLEVIQCGLDFLAWEDPASNQDTHGSPAAWLAHCVTLGNFLSLSGPHLPI